MKIQYINNTCDVEGIKVGGEIMVLLKDGKPVAHHDLFDDALNLYLLTDLFKPFGIDVEFEEITPSKELIKLINEYLIPIYGEEID